MKPLRVAVIGAGHLGRIHARLLKSVEGVALVGVVDPLAEARQRAAAEFETAVYAHHYEMLGKIDAAIVATPTRLHHDVALEMLRSGVHCFVEKPLCATSDEARDLVSAASARRLVLQVGHVERFNPLLAEFKIPSEPRYIESRRSSGYTFRSTDVGVVLDLMIHDIDLALSLAGGRVVDVQATGQTVIGPHEDIAQARLTFADGCVANLWASRVSPTAERTLSVYSEALHAALNLATRTAQVVRPCADLPSDLLDAHLLTAAEQVRLKERVFTDWLPLETIEAPERNAILDEQRDFVAGIATGCPVRVPGEAGRAALLVAERILERIAANSAACHVAASTLPLPLSVSLTAGTLRRAG